MIRREPPPIAVWLLEHVASGSRDEAIAGDLFEAFQSGRSSGWYWQQVLAACAVSWFESLRRRASLLAFALLWATLAPAWNSICSLVLNDSFLDRFCSIFGAVWFLPFLTAWTVAHSLFLWGGVLIFGVLNRYGGGNLNPHKFRRAFLVAPLIFVPAYGLVFLGVTLYWYSFFENFQLHASPLGQITDYRLLADAIRIPYLLALLWSLWRVVLTPTRATAWPDPSATDCSTDSPFGSAALPQDSLSNSFSVKRFFVLMIGAGLINSWIAGFLLCQLPESHSSTLVSLCMRAALYLLAGTLAGAVGTYLYWKNPASPFSTREPLPFRLFVLLCAAGWAWVPAMVILSEQLSPAFPFVAMIGAFILTSGIRRVSAAIPGPIPHRSPLSSPDEVNLFTDTFYSDPVEIHGYVVTLTLYVGATAFFFRWYSTAAIFLAFAISTFAWKNILPRDKDFDRDRESRWAASRLAQIAIPALLVTIWALVDGVTHRNLAEVQARNVPSVGDQLGKAAAQRPNGHATALGADGYESIILWPYPDRKLTVPFINSWPLPFAAGTKEPLVIRFNGPYWYIQPPNKVPGPTTHKAVGTPLGFDIRSSDSIPVVMNARQYLSASIPIARCEEIVVNIENRDNTPGRISLGVLLTDGESPKAATLYLGEQPILSTQPGQFTFKHAPVFETLHFPVHMPTGNRKFNEIVVLFLPDLEHTFDSPKIAIQDFELYRRF